MPVKLKKWNVLDQLRSEEEIALYLDACTEEDPGDGSLVRAAFADAERARVRLYERENPEPST